MSDPGDIPEPDAVPGAPHPRHARQLVGQAAAEAAFLAALGGGRLHHAWLVTGPRGVGKATLAWRLAQFLLAGEEGAGPRAPGAPATLDLPAEHPVVRRVASLSEPRLFLLRRAWDDKAGRLKTQITVDEVRRMKSFFALSAADGGHRVAIVDAAEEMNTSAANALLKLLEEPPRGAVLLLIAHQPARLLPTIRSRCRSLRCRPLGPDEIGAVFAGIGAGEELPDLAQAGALAELSGGSAGEALRLLGQGGLEAYADLVALFAAAPGIDRGAARACADACEGRDGTARFDLLLYLTEVLLHRLARQGAGAPPDTEAAPGEARMLARLATGPVAGRRWADLAAEVLARAHHGRAVNLDPSALFLDTLLAIDRAAERQVA